MWLTWYGISKFSACFVPLFQWVFLFSAPRASRVCKINVSSHIITSLFHLQVEIGCQLRRRECDHRPWLSQPGLRVGCLSARQGTWPGAVLLLFTCCETRRKLLHPSVLLLHLCQFEVLTLWCDLCPCEYSVSTFLPQVDSSQETPMEWIMY